MTSMASTLLEQNFVHSSRRGGRSEVVGYRTHARARARARGRARARDFESRAGSGAAGDRKVNGFQLKTFRKASILSAGQGRERPGIEKSSVFN